MRPVRLSRTVTTKVTAEEYEQITRLAAEQNRNVSEYVRRLLLTDAKCETSPEHMTLLSEILALRSILLTLIFRVNAGIRFSEPEMREVIERADADKDNRAQARFAAIQKEECPK